MSRRIRRSADKKTGRVVSRKTRRHFLRSCGLSAVAEGVQRDNEARSACEQADKAERRQKNRAGRLPQDPAAFFAELRIIRRRGGCAA